MNRIVLVSALLGLVFIEPGWAQNQESSPAAPNGEMRIPSEKVLERDAVTSAKNEFSTNDGRATRQMEQQNRRIDSTIMKGICTGC
jgi:hypothetical protein